MKPVSSLFAKLLAWFFLNLILVAAAMAVFFAFQSQINLRAIFGQHGRDRMRTAGMLIDHDLNQMSPANWSETLARHAVIHQVDFMLVLEDGSRFSSKEMDLPDELTKLVKRVLQRPHPRAPFPSPPRDDYQRLVKNRTAGSIERLPKRRAIGDRSPENTDRQTHKPLFMIRTRNPKRYWNGIKMPPLSVDALRHPQPGLLLAVSNSITGNGFFFDPLPWMIVATVVILISVLFWIPMVRNITRPLARMTLAAEEIAKGRFEVSIHEPRADEIGRLARAVNHMTSRLFAFVKGQKRFLGDVAHELGSPIARIQFGLGALEQRIKGENRKRVVDIIEDVDHLSKLVNELLAFSRAEINTKAVKLETMGLLPVVQAAVKREVTPAVRVIIRVNPKLRVLASSELLTRALANLLRNAVKYAGDAGPIIISAEKRKDEVDLEVRDNGLGVSADLLDQLFEPFFRPEPSRDRDSGGVGLGLAIVKTCVESCKGTVSAGNLKPNGFAVTITLKAG